MPSPNHQRVALVTGAAKRVGRAIALRLADEGFDIAFTYLTSQGDADQLATLIRGKGRRCITIKADLTDAAAAAETIFAEFSHVFSRLDALVNNASIYEPDEPDRSLLRQSQRLMAIHFESPLLLSRKFETHLRASQGHVINMVDGAVEKPLARYKAYTASKAALWNLTLSLARDLAPEVTVNGIAPGVIDWDANTDEQGKQAYLRRVPLARAGTPEDAAGVAAFLLAGGSYLTGQILRVDGGRSIT